MWEHVVLPNNSTRKLKIAWAHVWAHVGHMLGTCGYFPFKTLGNFKKKLFIHSCQVEQGLRSNLRKG